MMRIERSKLIFGLLFICSLAGTAWTQSPRAKFTINHGWQFMGADVADGQTSETTSWQKVDLPHTWNIADTLDDEPGYRRGISWYRKQLELAPQLSQKRIFIYFEGVNQTAEIFVNGKSVGRHIGGYSAFVFDVTELVRFDAANAIAVKVDNTLVNDIPPLDADFNMHGGIYRDVWIIAANDAHIEITDLASSGIVIRTPAVSNDRATVTVSGTVANASKASRRFEAVSSIVDADGRVASTARSSVNVSGGSESTFSHDSIRISRPKLWSPDSPYLYSVRTVIRENGRDIDEVTEPLGFRWFRFDPVEGFFLNGKPLKLRGTNRHQDHKGYGNAVPDELHVRDLEIIKETGFNFVRLAHYPQDPSVLAAADRLGLMLWEEIPIVNLVHLSEEFNKNSEAMLRDMIRQHRNHPSVILWGYMNEIFLRAPKNDAQTRATVELAKRLEKIAREEDPGRLTAIAFDRGGTEDRYHASGLGQITHVIGWNLYHGWYYQTFDDFGKFLDEQHRRFPTRPLFISEYGANADRRVHSLKPKRFDSTMEWQRMYHESYLRQITDRKFVSGSAVWNNFDFSSEFRGETIPHINQKGLFTYDRKAKDISYLYKASFVASPVLHIAVRDWQKRSGPSDQPVDVYTNLDEAELFLNGGSLRKRNGGPSRKMSWNVKLMAGVNSLVARGVRGGVPVTDTAVITWIDPADMRDIAVNAGSNAEYIHETGSFWHADQPYVAGGWGFTGSASKEAANLRIFGTEEDAVAQTAREGVHGYRFDVVDGEYEIELWFAELKAAKAGDRVFDVSLNGSMAITGFDPAKEAGPFSLITKKFRLSARNSEGIKVDLQAVKGQPTISGLRVRRIN